MTETNQTKTGKKRLHERRNRPVPTEPEGFRHERFLKADFFSRSDYGSYEIDGRRVPAVRRDVRFARWWTKPIALWFAARERRAMRRVDPKLAAPHLLYESRWTTVRSWIEGEPMQVAEPRDPAYFSEARKLLVSLQRCGIAHNDLAKQQNWLVTPQGKPALIDFQLASTFRRRSGMFRLMAREDLRHLLKHKRMYCPNALTPSEKRMLATPSLPSRIWRATGKRLYNFVTRKIFRWSDGEGMGELPTRPAAESEKR